VKRNERENKPNRNHKVAVTTQPIRPTNCPKLPFGTATLTTNLHNRIPNWKPARTTKERKSNLTADYRTIPNRNKPPHQIGLNCQFQIRNLIAYRTALPLLTRSLNASGFPLPPPNSSD